MKLILAQPRGFCAGVDRAIEIVERALQKYGPPVYVRHEIVHNKTVVDDLRAKGAVFVDEVNDIPDGAVTIFSAHGVSDAVEDAAHARELPVIDATCPLVTKVHNEARRSATEGREIILIGHAGHPEVEGTSGRVKEPVHLVETEADVQALQVRNPEKLAYVTQTTLSVDDTRSIIEVLKMRFPSIKGPDLRDICYATQNRQDAVRVLATQVELLLVVGAKNSSNSNRLRDLGEQSGAIAYLIDTVENIDPAWLENIKTVGLTAGASAPDRLVQDIVSYFKTHHNADVSTMDGKQERTRFKLPEILESAA